MSFQFMIVHTLSQYVSLYEDRLKAPSCLPLALEDLCSGWTTDTFKQILVKLTLNGKIAVPCVFNHFNELAVFSNKQNTLQEIFKLFDTRAFSRIDAMELISAIAMICSGPLDKKIENCFFAFGLSEDLTVTKDEMHLFLDSLFRGNAKVALVNTDTFYPRNPNKRVSAHEISLICDSIFTGKIKSINSEGFCQWLLREQGAMSRFFNLFVTRFQQCQEASRELNISRLRIIPFVKTLIYNEILQRASKTLGLEEVKR